MNSTDLSSVRGAVSEEQSLELDANDLRALGVRSREELFIELARYADETAITREAAKYRGPLS